MTTELAAALAPFISLLVTIVGWIVIASAQRELAKRQGEIQKIVSEHSTRFTYLYQRQGQVIEELYRKVDKITRLFGASARSTRVKLDAPIEEQQDKAMKTFWELFEYYHQNRLYIDEKLAQQLLQFFGEVFGIDTTLGAALTLRPFMFNYDPLVAKQYSDYADQVRNKIAGLDPIRINIEKEMRYILYGKKSET